MGLTPRLEVRQSQSLTLTPQLMQSIRLLQLSHLELDAFIDAELLRNPLLEREDGAAPEESEAPQEVAVDRIADDAVGDTERIRSADSIAEGYDTEVENVFPEQPWQDRLERTGSYEASGQEGPDLDQFASRAASLGEHLGQQAGLLFADPVERLVAQVLTDSLDEAGYLGVALEEVAEQIGAPLPFVESVLKRLQGLDPVGIYARNLAECLCIQLRERDRLDPMMQRLVARLDLVASHDMPALLRAVGCDREDLLDMLAEIRSLDPRPGRSFGGAPIEAVVPDVFVREGPDGWLLELNSDILPRVLVNRSYYATVSRHTRDPAGRAFLSECLSTATWLTKSLDQRAQTILKVSSEIVRQQDDFLRRGVTFLHPMTLKLVADAIGMHESTVSRVTSNKYIATPRGVFELKYFFTTALGATGGGEHSAEAVRHRIRQLVEAEGPDDILSDDTIADLLQKEQGIEVARRTVAKYREGMNIPSSVIRRRQKRAMAMPAR